jgi:hypothetical protein
MSHAIQSHRHAQDGTLELFELLGHLERIANQMLALLRPDLAVISGNLRTIPEFSTSGDSLVFAGYSRVNRSLVIRMLRYQGGVHGWKFEKIRPTPSLGPAKTIAIFGDNASRSRFRYHLKTHLLSEESSPERSFEFEPLRVLTDLLLMPESSSPRLPRGHRPHTTGGVPQVVRLIPGAPATIFAVEWRPIGSSDGVFIGGRPALEYERLDTPLITITDRDIQLHGRGEWRPSGTPNPIYIVEPSS